MSALKRIGFLGVAHAHVDMYAAVWRERPELGVGPVAVWDSDPARSAAFSGKYALEAMADAGALLARADLDAVVIGSETSRHADRAVAAAAAGKAIVLQKPLCLTLEEADRIVSAVSRHRAPFTLAWQMRVDPHNLKIRELLADGRFGKVYMIRRRHCLSTQNWKGFDESWHVKPELNRDIFADDAAHPVDFLYWLLGKPRSVMCELGTLLNPKIPNDNGIALFRYPDGAFGEVSCSFAAVAGENAVEAVCEHGTIVLNFGDGVSGQAPWPPGGIQLKWWHRDDGRWMAGDLPDIPQHGARIRGLAEPLADFLHGRRAPLATAEEGRDVLKMILACYESASQGRRVTV